MRVCLSVLLSLVALTQQPPPRDAAPPSANTGTGVIGGRVVAGDTGAPIAYATVSVYKHGEPPWRDSVMTDRSGRFEIQAVPVGPVLLSAQPPSYQRRYQVVRYPRPEPNRPLEPLQVAAGQRLDNLQLVLPVLSAITGRVLGDDGLPMCGVQVAALKLGAAEVTEEVPSSMSTDDRGVFRLYGLPDGDYVVRASFQQMPTVHNTPGGAELKPPPFAPTYYPGTLSRREAAKLRIRNAQEVGDVEMYMIRTRLFRVSGVILDSRGQPLTGNPVTIVRVYENGASGQQLPLDASARFNIRDVVPGDYIIQVQPHEQTGVDSSALREYASVPVAVVDADVVDLVVRTRPGVDLSGRLVFEQGVPTSLRELYVAADAESPGIGAEVRPARVQPDLSFRLQDLSQPTLIRLMGLPAGWSIKAVMLGNHDITDSPLEFKPNETRKLEIVLTTRAATVEGTITDDRGEPVSSAGALLFSIDPSEWLRASTRTRWAFLGGNGRYKMAGLRSGKYFIVATTLPVDGVLYRNPRPVLEMLAKSATEIYVGDDEQRTIDLKLTKLPEDRP